MPVAYEIRTGNAAQTYSVPALLEALNDVTHAFVVGIQLNLAWEIEKHIFSPTFLETGFEPGKVLL